MSLFKGKLNRYVHFITVLILFGMVPEVCGQKNIEYSFVRVEHNKEIKPVDLTDEVKRKCDRVIKKQIGQRYLEIRYPAAYFSEAQLIANNLSNAIKRTQEILFPLPTENVKFYFLQKDTIPPSYKMAEKVKDEDFYLHLWVFKNREEINFDCSDKKGLCQSIYEILPHELAHEALDGLLSTKNIRWFQEGLADYVSDKITSEIAEKPQIFENVIPEISLHRKEIREAIFSWGYSNQNDAQNQYYRYQAALQLIKLIVKESERKETDNPLQILFSELIKQKQVKNNTATAEDLTAIIKQLLKVDIKMLGVLDNERKTELVGKAGKVLSEPNAGEPNRHKALYILAGIDDITLTPELMKYLLAQVFRDNKNTLFRDLAATALIRRSGQTGFEEAIEVFVKENPSLKDNSPNKVKKYLQELSTRPLMGNN